MLFLALRHLLSRKKQTIFIFLGVILGTAVYIFISGTQLGFRAFIVEQLVENDAHLKISGREEYIDAKSTSATLFGEKSHTFWVSPPAGKRDEARILYPQGWFERLKDNPEVVAFSEQMTLQVISSKGPVKNSAQFVGVVPEKQKKVTVIDRFMTEGKFSDIGQSGNRIVVGDGLLKKLGAQLGDNLMLASTGAPPRPFKIVGIFHLGVQQMDEGIIYGALRDVQQIAGTPGRITQIAVRLQDVDMARPLSETLAVGAIDKVQSWDQANQSILQVFKIQDLFRLFITGGILIIAAFGIYNVLSIIVNQKKKEVAILRSLGYTPNEVLMLFLIQGLVIGTIGATFGLLLGFGLSWWMTTIRLDAMGMSQLYISFAPSIYVTAFAMALVSSLVASLVPARAASRMTPIEIIRQEGG